MTNINCSIECVHESNGKCSLNHVGIISEFTGEGTDCAYFTPKKKTKERGKAASN